MYYKSKEKMRERCFGDETGRVQKIYISVYIERESESEREREKILLVVGE